MVMPNQPQSDHREGRAPARPWSFYIFWLRVIPIVRQSLGAFALCRLRCVDSVEYKKSVGNIYVDRQTVLCFSMPGTSREEPLWTRNCATRSSRL